MKMAFRDGAATAWLWRDGCLNDLLPRLRAGIINSEDKA